MFSPSVPVIFGAAYAYPVDMSLLVTEISRCGQAAGETVRIAL